MKINAKVIIYCLIFTVFESWIFEDFSLFFVLFILNGVVFAWMFNKRQKPSKSHEERDDSHCRDDSYTPSELRAYLAAEKIKDIKRNL